MEYKYIVILRDGTTFAFKEKEKADNFYKNRLNFLSTDEGKQYMKEICDKNYEIYKKDVFPRLINMYREKYNIHKKQFKCRKDYKFAQKSLRKELRIKKKELIQTATNYDKEIYYISYEDRNGKLAYFFGLKVREIARMKSGVSYFIVDEFID
jgi:hypothetical protein